MRRGGRGLIHTALRQDVHVFHGLPRRRFEPSAWCVASLRPRPKRDENHGDFRGFQGGLVGIHQENWDLTIENGIERWALEPGIGDPESQIKPIKQQKWTSDTKGVSGKLYMGV